MIFLLGARCSAIPMNNLSVSLWAVLLKEIVQAGGPGNDRYTRFPFHPPPHLTTG